MRGVISRQEPRTLGMLLVMLLLAITVLLFTFVQWPAIKNYRAALESREHLGANIRTSEQLVERLAMEKASIEALNKRLHGDMTGLPIEQMEAYVIGRLQKLSWNAGVELIGVRPREGQQVEIFREILFDVEVTGRYFDFFNWLRSVGNDLGFVVVKSFEIRPVNTTQEDPELRVVLGMAAYRVER
ncbi:MAG: hypothetical protein C0631_07960 [Sedimenticola sp.]|jgi:Tfp pilus assembly protein PilO|nr:MAG: hypothetical protein C0631_07960 [Sedimenticola sp.]